ncbi:response regulator [Paenibacillus sp. PAMC21692]|uniref:response regulator transcription factor n=1 Tax=Paenibacillus sp. PAMC21692 TaxID=2762320 RepID=UPI00164DAAA9|nr:response regulator [Paenibacillus sp. PAMC21692]QNK59364.1 response regulator [Paenibacillus sp. PAMC21692]
MYKVFIVDDDYTVRTDLKDMIDKNKKYVCIGEAENGEVALDRIRETKPDIILLDIEMPVMDGLTSLPHILEGSVCCKVIVLSCHDDYDNVRLAMKHGAAEYLLKQRMDEDNLFKTLNQVASLIDNDRISENELLKRRRDDTINLPAVMNTLVIDMIRGHITDVDLIGMKIGAIQSKFPMDKLVVSCLIVDESERHSTWKDEPFVFAIENVLGEIIDNTKGTIYGKSDKKTFYMISGFRASDSYLYINNFIYGLVDEVSSAIQRYLKLTVTVGVSPVFATVSQVSEAARQASLATEYSFFSGKGSIIHYTETEKHTEKWSADRRKVQIKSIILNVTKEDDQVESAINSLASEFRSELLDIQTLKDFHAELMFAFNQKIEELSLTRYIEHFDRAWPNMELTAYIRWLSKLITRIREVYLEGKQSKFSRDDITRALAYLDSHYMNITSLNDVAKHINLNKSYFSQIFKREIKENFTVYLTKLRIDKAKALLSDSDTKVYEVSSLVGIENYRYFSKVFKELTGLTPIEYRKRSQLG